MLEYKENSAKYEAGKQTHFTDVLQCYCDTAANFSPKTKVDKTATFTITDPSTNKKYSVAVCSKYDSIKITGKLFGTAIAFVIIAVNLVLKTVIIKLITWIKVDTESEQLTAISTGVFIAQFFNTGLLVLFVNANLTEHEP